MTAAQKQSPLTNQENPIEVMAVREMKLLLSWKAPIRVFKRRGREFWTTVAAIVVLVTIILIFILEMLLIAAIIALVFVYYMLSTVPPEEIEHQITTRGIRFAGADYPWEEFSQFWFTNRWNHKILNLSFRNRIPGRLELVLGEVEEKKVKEIMSRYLPEETPPPSFMDKASDWLIKKVPLETEK